MQSQSSDAVYSAIYVGNYLDYVEEFPNRIQLFFSQIRELDVTYGAYLKESAKQQEFCYYYEAKNNKCKMHRSLRKMEKALIAMQNISDEKLQISQYLTEMIEKNIGQLDKDYKNIDFINKVLHYNGTQTSSKKIFSNLETAFIRSDRQTRKRRTRSESTEDSDSMLSESITSDENFSPSSPKKKKRTRKHKGKKQGKFKQETTTDIDDTKYCLCNEISHGDMIMCDNSLCLLGWFHFGCVDLSTKPKGKWFCPKCRGDKPNVMKPKVQLLQELNAHNEAKL